MRLSLLIFVGIFIGALPGTAHARTIPVICQKAQDGSLMVDGIFTDWQGATTTHLKGQAAVQTGGTGTLSGASDLSAAVHCGHTSKALFFWIKVRDEYIVRTGTPTPSEDHIAFHFKDGKGVRTLAFFPPDGRQKPAYGVLKKARRRRKWTVSKQRGMTAAVIRLSDGYALEVSMANNVIPCYGPGTPALDLTIQIKDVDSKAQMKVKTVLGNGGDTLSSLGRIEFEAAKALLAQFLKDRGLTAAHIKMNRVANFVTGKSLERVLIADRYLAMIGGDVSGGTYYYLTLPVQRSTDILRFTTKDMDGDGQPEVLIRLRQSRGNRAREIFLIYRYGDTGGFAVIFGHEVMHKMGPRLLTNTYRYIKKRRGIQMEFAVGKCVGWTKANHQAAAPNNMQAILTPWSEKTKLKYKFTSEGFEETD